MMDRQAGGRKIRRQKHQCMVWKKYIKVKTQEGRGIMQLLIL